MSARLVWVLLLLAAVFSMHGLQCVAADGEDGHGRTTSASAVVHVAALAEPVGWTLMAVGHQALDAVSATAPLSDGLPGHGASYWAVCLAVLMTGAIFLGVTALVRRAPAAVVRARAPALLRHTGWSRLPRPPDLSALCLLRI